MEETVKTIPSDTLTIRIEKNEYTIKFPKTGLFIDVEREKVRMSGGYQNQLVETNTGFLARMMIDAIATFSVLIPSLTKDLNYDNIFETDILFAKKIVKIYSKEFLPWYNSWVDLLHDIDVD